MDGTLLNDAFQLSSATKDAIARVVARGVHFVLVSGRMRASLMPFHEELCLTTPAICYNGAMIWDPTSKTVVSHTPIPYEVAQEILNLTEPEDLHVQYFWDDRFFAVKRTSWMELYESRTRLSGEIIPSLREFGPNRLATKMQIIAEPDRVRSLVRDLSARFNGRLYVTNTLPEYVEMMSPSVSKGAGLVVAGNRLGVPTERMLVFGDAQNDETMFAVAGYSVAMGNARADVRAKAHFVTASNTNDGVAQALDALGLLD
jgi:hypothetical protein